MDLERIAQRISAEPKPGPEDRVGFNPDVLGLLTPDMLDEMGIPEESSPRKEGINSAVFENGRGNVVVYTLRKRGFDAAGMIDGPLSEILPEIVKSQAFDMESPFGGNEWTVPSDKVYAIEMERLRPLDTEERLAFSAWQNKVFPGTGGFDDDPEKAKAELLAQGRDVDVQSPAFKAKEEAVVSSMQALASRARSLAVSHDDVQSGNVAWDGQGRLKFIDLDDVNLGEIGQAQTGSSMDLKAVAARLAADPKRKAIFTTRGRVDSESPGPARDRTVEEMAEHLEKDRDTAVLVWTGKSWAAVLRDRSAPDKWAVTKLPATDASNKIGDRIPSARDAVEAAMKLSGSDLPDPEPSEA